MEVLKSLLWCCMAVTIAASKRYGSQLSSSVLNNVPTKECYCMPNSGTGLKVSDMHVPQKERLVVYLYKSVHGEITVHIPSVDKQSVLPDLEIESNDVFKKNVKFYTVVDMFRTNMSQILIPNDAMYPILDHSHDPSVVNKYDIHVPTDPHVHNKGIPFTNGIPTDNVFGHLENVYFPTHNEKMQVPPKGIDRNLLLMDMINNKHHDPLLWASNKPVNINQLHQGPVVGPVDHTRTIPIDVFNPFDPNVRGQHQRLPFVFDNEMNVPNYYLQNSPNIKFDNWLLSQMNILMSHKLYSKYAIDINTLRGLVVETLQNNGLQISDSGLLIDSKGQRIEIDNLKLNPVLLGDPVEYQKRFAVKGCLTPHDLPHIETVLLSSTYPPRIVGIIPLKSVMQTSHSNVNIPICSQSILDQGGRCQHMPSLSPGSSKFSHKVILNNLLRRKNNEDDENVVHPLSDVIENNMPFENVIGVDGKKDVGKASEHVATLEETDTDVDYGDLGIRVLGGQSATSSGAPLSNKGRSAMA